LVFQQENYITKISKFNTQTSKTLKIFQMIVMFDSTCVKNGYVQKKKPVTLQNNYGLSGE